MLHKTPFALLGVTTRDDRRRIVEIAEGKSLELDHDACQKARSDLTNPRTRLSAEIAWLPGVSPARCAQLLALLSRDPMAVRKEAGLPVLARLNLLAAAFEAIGGGHDRNDLQRFIQDFANCVESLDPEVVLRDINEDRMVSRFPAIRALDQIEAEVADRKRYYRTVVRDALDRLPPAALVAVMTATLDGVTHGGTRHAPELIDDLVDRYEVESQDFLQTEAENVRKLIKSTRQAMGSGEIHVAHHLDKLCAVARNWDKVAQPIQLSAKARGLEHTPSRDLALEIRGLAIELFNSHGMLSQTQRLTALMKELFAELPNLADLMEQDTRTLAEIAAGQKQEEARKAEFDREITYHAEIGTFFKKSLSISPDGIAWQGQRFPLQSVTRVRWGGVRQSINGIPTGTTFTIAFGDQRSEAVVELGNQQIFSTFLDKLWRGVCVRLVGEMLEALEGGGALQFGNARVHDDGVTLMRVKFIGSDERVRCSWSETTIWEADGMFYISHKNDRKLRLALSYIHDDNTHILEQVLRMAFKVPGLRRLSDLLRQ